MNKVKHLFLVLLLVMAHLQLSATNIELSWSFNQGDAKALQGTISKEGLFSYCLLYTSDAADEAKRV